jgi:hypothetical protein
MNRYQKIIFASNFEKLILFFLYTTFAAIFQKSKHCHHLPAGIRYEVVYSKQTGSDSSE